MVLEWKLHLKNNFISGEKEFRVWYDYMIHDDSKESQLFKISSHSMSRLLLDLRCYCLRCVGGYVSIRVLKYVCPCLTKTTFGPRFGVRPECTSPFERIYNLDPKMEPAGERFWRLCLCRDVTIIAAIRFALLAQPIFGSI